MALKLFEITEQLMMETFLLEITQFEKAGSNGKTLNSLGNLIINFHFRNYKSNTFFVAFMFLLFNSGVYLPFNNGNALNLKKSQVKPRKKSKLSVDKFQLFPEKKNQQNL